MPSGSMWPIPVQRTQTWLHPAGWSQGDPSSTTPPRLQALASVLLGDFLLSGDSQEFWDRDSGKSNLSYMHGTFNGMLVCQKDVNWCSKETLPWGSLPRAPRPVLLQSPASGLGEDGFRPPLPPRGSTTPRRRRCCLLVLLGPPRLLQRPGLGAVGRGFRRHGPRRLQRGRVAGTSTMYMCFQAHRDTELSA